MPQEVLAVVPARGGSKSIPRKNVKPLAGLPLIAYSIREAQKSRYIRRIVVTTDDPLIAQISRDHGAEVPFLRPAELAEDSVLDLPVFQHCLRWLADNEAYIPEVVVHLRPTAPLRLATHIDQGIELLLQRPEADCVRSVCRVDRHPLKMWRIDDGRLQPFIPGSFGIPEAYNMPRQKLPPAYVQNGSVDVIRPATIMAKGSMTGEVIIPLVMEELDSVNIDSPIDFELAELLMLRRHREGVTS